MTHDLFNSRQTFKTGNGSEGTFYSLPQLEKEGIGHISRLPISIRIVLESVLRNFDGGKRVSESNIRELAGWVANRERTQEIPFVVARVILQDFTGVPLLVDLAAMRSAVTALGKDAGMIEPLVPVDLVIDHSVQVDYAGSEQAYQQNMAKEFERNDQRYRFLKWGTQAFNGFSVIPPGIGIVHQVNLEYLAKGVFEREGVYFPDSLVGTDSHTTMINGLGIVGWGVGGIEAEAAMLGQPCSMLIPLVVGFKLKGKLLPGVTATDLVLTVTQQLRKKGVVGKFVEFYGPGLVNLTSPIARRLRTWRQNMAQRWVSSPLMKKRLSFYALQAASPRPISSKRTSKRKTSGMMPSKPDSNYSDTLELDLSTVEPSLAGPARPQDRIPLGKVNSSFSTYALELAKGDKAKATHCQ